MDKLQGGCYNLFMPVAIITYISVYVYVDRWVGEWLVGGHVDVDAYVCAHASLNDLSFSLS